MKKIVLVMTVMIASSAMALTLKEQKQFKTWQTYLTDESQSYVKTVQEKCGYSIPLTIEDKFVAPFMAGDANAASYCDSTRSVISDMCGDETSKAAIKKNIKKINCKLGKKEEATYSMSGGTLTFTVGLGASNLERKAKDFLENHLQ